MPAARPAALLCAPALLLAACATPVAQETAPPENAEASAAAPATPPRAALPPQDLAIGECGVFFWSAERPHRFLVFENETRGQARVWIGGRAAVFGTPPRRGQPVFGDPFERSYRDPASELSVSISGTIGDPLQAGQRIDRTVMRYRRSDGAQMVVPLIGHHACRTDRTPPAAQPGPGSGASQ